MPTTIEDRLVVGDPTVVADLYRQHGAFIHTVSQELVGAAADRLTQQIFVEAWRDRLDFDPSMGTVRNWFVRRARDRVSKPTVEGDAAVDRLVVADSLNRMDAARQRVIRAGVAASDVDQVAAELDLPLATVNGHLRRGMESLKADLADSRSDGSDAVLADILADGTPEATLNAPPMVVWNAVVAELRLSGDAADLDHVRPPDDVEESDGSESLAVDSAHTAAADGGEMSDADHVQEVSGTEAVDGDLNDGEVVDANAGPDHLEADDNTASLEPPHENSTDNSTDDGTDDSVEALRADAVLTDLNRPIWQNPAAVIVALIVLALLIAIIF